MDINMTRYEKWEKLKKEMGLAESWINYKGKIDCINKRPYEIKARLSNDSIQWCGQQYSGEKNYHPMPDYFARALSQVIVDEADRLFGLTLAKIENETFTAAIQCKSELEIMLENIKEVINK